ncbi:uncharacterized protein LOC123272965 [Cotesia glomerata]|uniref:uncharacterized protein LOC123272965 n=1 Tax=Cotesia glomerata TaxID=32391 RepID=UPI001D012067|nr:uncharacterized protein LOC123272965 [Cotesia glomerata]
MNVQQYLIYDLDHGTYILQFRYADDSQVAMNVVRRAEDPSEERLLDDAILEMTRSSSNIIQSNEEKSEIIKIQFFDLSVKSEEELYEYIRCQENWYRYITYKYFRYGPLHVAARFGDLDLVKDIMKKTLPCCSLNQSKIYSAVVFNETLLESGIRSDNVDLVRFLIENGANFSSKNVDDPLTFLILVYAFRIKSNNIIKAFLNKDDVKHVSPIFGSLITCAIYNGDLSLIHNVLRLGAYINSLSVFSERFIWFYGTLTPLQTAIALKKVDIVKLLIRCGANVDYLIPGLKYQMTTLQYAVKINTSRDIIVALLDAGADVFYLLGNYVLPFSDKHRSQLITRSLKEMVIKLDTVGFNLLKTNRIKRILKDKKLDHFKWKCFEEVERMDTTQIETTNITYYDLLTRDVYELATDDQYAVLKSAAVDKDLEKQFPLYAGIILARFKNAVKTKIRLPEFENFILNIFPDAPIDLIDKLLPYVCEEGLEVVKSRGSFAFQKLVNSMTF